jgi:shikimate kinase
MKQNKSNIVLIGMPGSGKSTVGVILAKMLARDFVDTDVLIQVSKGRSLQEIVDTQGYLALRKVEEKVLLNLKCKNHIIATGGSAVYSEEAMIHLRSDGILVFLNVNLHNLLSRVYDYATRGLAKPSEQSFAELFEERIELYRKFADITVKGSGLKQEEVCEEIIKALRSDQDRKI